VIDFGIDDAGADASWEADDFSPATVNGRVWPAGQLERVRFLRVRDVSGPPDLHAFQKEQAG
jgi:hypothetical protein